MSRHGSSEVRKLTHNNVCVLRNVQTPARAYTHMYFRENMIFFSKSSFHGFVFPSDTLC